MQLSVATKERLAQAYVAAVESAVAAVPATVTGQSFSQVEGAMEEATRQIGRQGLELVLHDVGTPRMGLTRACACGETQTTDHYATAHRQTVLGRVRLRRAAYRCATCGRTECPWDAQVGVPEAALSARLQARLSLFCAATPFADATRWLAEASGVHVSAKHAQLVSEALGTRLTAFQSAGPDRPETDAPESAVAAPHPKRLYLGLDGAFYCTTETDEQGKRCWREAKVAVSFRPKPPGRPSRRKRKRRHPTSRLVPDGPVLDLVEPDSQRYVAYLGDWHGFAAHVWQEMIRQGVEHAEELVVLGDGARWIQSLVNELFAALPLRLTRILDIRHAEQYLWAVGRACLGERVLAWIQNPLADLRHGRVAALVAAVQALPVPSTAAADLIATTAAYYTERQEQMAYPAFRARGLQIGSGLAESGCKRVISQRLCGSGMQWTTPGAQAIASLRAADLSSRWSDVQLLAGVA